jgi:hypothetical protein
MGKRIRFVLLVLVAAGLLWRFVGFALEGAQAAPVGDSPFAGKVVVVYTNVSSPPAAVLEKARLKRLGGRQFLVGTHIGYSPAYQPGRTVWVAVDSIVSMMELENANDARKTLEPAPAPMQPGQPGSKGTGVPRVEVPAQPATEKERSPR